MEIEGIGTGIEPIATGVAGGELGKDEFLKLLMAQMQNQDPLNPMNAQDTIAQLAQFSALEQMQNLNVQFEASRKENNLLQSLFLNGENIRAQMESGSEIEGIIDKVLWENNELAIQIAGTSYPVKNIVSISKIETPAE